MMSNRFTLPPRYTLGSSKSLENDSDSDSSTYHCHYCSTQNSHAGDNLEALFECEICLKKFRQLSTYTRHKKMHNPKEKVFLCLLCTHTCESELKMRSHVTEAHTPTEDFYKSNKTYNKVESDKDLRNQHTCQICLKTFKKKCHLYNHIRCHTPKLKCEKKCGSSSKKQSPYRNVTLQQPSHKEECAKDILCEPHLENGFLKSGIAGTAGSYSSSIGQVNFWPRVVLSSHLNILLSRRSE